MKATSHETLAAGLKTRVPLRSKRRSPGTTRVHERTALAQLPGGRSALRAATAENPRDLPCPDCGRENVLTPKDRALGYCCDSCADSNEGFGP